MADICESYATARASTPAAHFGYRIIAGLALANNIPTRSGTAEDIRIATAAARSGDTIVILAGRFAFHGQVV
jgi:hypothetical protein